ncbi:Zinc finger and SCAN domain-containing protein 2 [Merluccius polli]|uniref:Zinc finger and SCAN domain-containing protein 2 n=1 Tax=Merluccius polli TaxID=89951 RepID=A0AA47MER8_MERPO|nr:Zinc finger and SCAN domain-containing protein 2 [Merluccius polli]
MEMVKVEEVIVETHGSTSREIKSEPAEVPPRPRPPCKSNGNKMGNEGDKHPTPSRECLQCFIIFASDRSMLRHNRKFHKEEYMQHLQKNNTVFLCYKCNQRFRSSAKLRRHNLTHGTDDKPFRCEICREGYATFSELLTHRREVCPKNKFRCKLCGMIFQNLDSLLTHKSMHLPRKRGRPPKKKPEEVEEEEVEEEEEDEEEEDEEDEEEDEEEEVDSRAEDRRALMSQMSWTADKKTVVPKEEEEEEEVDGRAEDQRALRVQMSSPQGSASESQLTMKRGQLTMNYGYPPKKKATESWTPDTKPMVPKKEEEEEEEVDGRAEDQRAVRAQTSSPQGRASETQQPRYNIPCSVDYCELSFPSVEALRAHKKDVHRPQPTPELAPPCLP